MTAPPVLGSYRLLAELGHGGMADVFLAVAEGPAGLRFSKLAVLKMLREHLADDPDSIAMLIDEARLTARLTHPNIVQLFEVGKADGQYFLAMEYLDGQPLHRVERRLERRAKHEGATVPRDIYYAVVSDVLAGLHYAHELADYDGTPLHVIHRDVTPHNVFVTYDGAVKVVDFGLAKAVGRATQTEHGIVKGKMRYMSPEQAVGEPIDRRADVFAAGVILWNAATGSKLWADRTDVAIAHALEAGDFPASPREIHPEVPIEIDAICRKALACRREDRYATADAMRVDIERYLGRRSADARKRLISAVTEVFAADRKKVREVLEASGLTLGPATSAPTANSGTMAPAPTMAKGGENVTPREVDEAAVSYVPRKAVRVVWPLAIVLAVIFAVSIVLSMRSRGTTAPATGRIAARRVVASGAAKLSSPSLRRATSSGSATDEAASPGATTAPAASLRATKAMHGTSRHVDTSATPAATEPSTASPVAPPAPARAPLDSSDPWRSPASRGEKAE